MQYQGGKSRIAKSLVEAILGLMQGREVVIEPFCGGGSVTAALAGKFKHVRAYDINEDLILMWKALQSGWIPPSHVSEEEYKRLRDERPSPLRGFVGFGCSWGGKWFGGYARYKDKSYAATSARVVLKQAKALSTVEFCWGDYLDINVPSGAVVYADPPYANTLEYQGKFDSVKFWGVAHAWADKGAQVFVSELSAPQGWKSVWEKEVTRSMRGDRVTSWEAVERLWTPE